MVYEHQRLQADAERSGVRDAKKCVYVLVECPTTAGNISDNCQIEWKTMPTQTFLPLQRVTRD